MITKHLKTPLVLVGIFAASLVFGQVATVQGRDEGAEPILTQKRNNVANCEVVGENIQKRLVKYTKNENTHTEQYRKTYNHIVALVDKLEEEGKDVASIRLQLIELDGAIAKFNSDYKLYLDSLEGTGEFACDRSEPEFKAKLEQARKQLKLVHEDSVFIRTFWAKNIKPNIVALKTAAQPVAEEEVTNER